mmetsp:Transcript_1149/g.2547  ORF Transcript_1149/g.2547 Transcript_1149/m.2547 type:complete len:84 (+) Transcript_1149:2021-2272(+)
MDVCAGLSSSSALIKQEQHSIKRVIVSIATHDDDDECGHERVLQKFIHAESAVPRGLFFLPAYHSQLFVLNCKDLKSECCTCQ